MPREKSKRRKIWQWLGIPLVVCGLGLLGYFVYQKVQIDYYQYRLRKAYEDTFYDLPDGSDKFDDIVMTERQPMRLVIPKINVDLIVQVGDVFDMALLDKGPVHFQMSDLPSTCLLYTSQKLWLVRWLQVALNGYHKLLQRSILGN